MTIQPTSDKKYHGYYIMTGGKVHLAHHLSKRRWVVEMEDGDSFEVVQPNGVNQETFIEHVGYDIESEDSFTSGE